MTIDTDRMFNWIDVLKGVKEDWPKGSHRYKMIDEVIEFLAQARVDYFLHPGRRFDRIEEVLVEHRRGITKIEQAFMKKNEPIFPGPTEPLRLDLEDLSKRLDTTQRNLEYTARKLNQLEEDMKHMECHNEVQAKWVSELRCLHADEIRKWSDELSDIEQK